ncbi:MAG: DUF3352 domain-containing protein [Candidatus Omnitrophica bacterium]|nr:DUF3352 domain-containing protein [Candidatus Omnitrophota bacterium]
MKKIVVIVLCVFLVGAGIFYLNRRGMINFAASNNEIEKVMPENPFFYVDLIDTKKNVERLSNTSFWKRLSQINFDAMLKDDKLSPQEKTVIQYLKQVIQKPNESELINKFLNKEIAVAVYGLQFDSSLFSRPEPQIFQNVVDEIFSKLLFVVRLDTQSQMTELITSSLGKLGENVTISDETYMGKDMKSVTIKDIPYKLVYTRINDLMIIGIGETSVQKSIEVFQGKAKSLFDNKDYVLAKSKYVRNPKIKTFFNVEKLVSSLEEFLIQMPVADGIAQVEQRKNISQTFDSIKGFKSANLSIEWTDLMEIKVNLLFDKKNMNTAMAKYYDACQNQDNQSINFVPAGSLAYVWGNCFDLNYYWEELKKEMEAAEPAGKWSTAEQLAAFEQTIGLTVEGDILPAFGNEIGGYVKDIHADGNFPIPEFTLFIKIKDQAKVEKLLGLLKNQPVVALQNEDYNGVNLNYIDMPISEHVSPAYCFLNDFLLISINKQLLKNSIDTSKKTMPSLVSNAAFKILNQGLTDKSIGVQFYKMDEIAFKMAGILEWSNNWITANDQKKEAFKSGARMRLTQVQKEIEDEEAELKQKEQQVKDLEKIIVDLETAGQDAAAQKNELQILNNKIKDYKYDIATNVQNAMKIEESMDAYSTTDNQKRQLYIDHVMIPVVDSLKVIEGVGIKSLMSSDSMDGSVFLKL